MKAAKFVSLLCSLVVTSLVVIAQEAKTVARKVLPSVVLVEVFDSTGRKIGLGSGFFVRKDVVATNYHVIEKATTARITISEGNSIDVIGAVGLNKERDLALLKTSHPVGQPLTAPFIRMRPCSRSA